MLSKNAVNMFNYLEHVFYWPIFGETMVFQATRQEYGRDTRERLVSKAIHRH